MTSPRKVRLAVIEVPYVALSGGVLSPVVESWSGPTATATSRSDTRPLLPSVAARIPSLAFAEPAKFSELPARTPAFASAFMAASTAPNVPFPLLGLATVLCRSTERLELAAGDRRDDEAFR